MYFDGWRGRDVAHPMSRLQQEGAPHALDGPSMRGFTVKNQRSTPVSGMAPKMKFRGMRLPSWIKSMSLQ